MYVLCIITFSFISMLLGSGLMVTHRNSSTDTSVQIPLHLAFILWDIEGSCILKNLEAV